MKNDVLAHLYEDHARFERFFRAIEPHCPRAAVGHTAGILRLKAVVQYLSLHEFPRHQALEEALFAKLLTHRPRFREDIFDLTEDHRVSQREFKRLTRAMEAGNGNLEEALRSFVANERAHFIAEEETLFHAAAQCLSEEDWHFLSEGLKAESERSAPPGDLDPATDTG